MSIADKLLAAIEAFDFSGTIPQKLIGNDVVEFCDGITLANIFDTETVNISQMLISDAGITTDWHRHDFLEIFCLQKGESYILEIEDEEDKTVKYIQPVYVHSNKAHRFVKTNGKSISIVVSIPSNRYFHRR